MKKAGQSARSTRWWLMSMTAIAQSGCFICEYSSGHVSVTPQQYERLIAERERKRLVRTLREGLARGETLERTLERLQNQPPRQA